MKKFLLCVATFVATVGIAFAQGYQINTISQDFAYAYTAKPNANGDMAWYISAPSGVEIAHYDAATRTAIQISNSLNGSYDPDINDNGDVVWWQRGLTVDDEIFLYDAATGNVRQISTGGGDNQFPKISNNGNIVWQGPFNTVLLYEAATGNIRELTNDPALGTGSGIRPVMNANGDVAWEGWTSSSIGRDILFYDGAAQTVTTIANTGFNSGPLMNDRGDMVWSLQITGSINSEIMHYDAATQVTTQITSNGDVNNWQQYQINNQGDVSYVGYTPTDATGTNLVSNVYLYQSATMATTQLTTLDGTTPLISVSNPQISDSGDVAYVKADGSISGMERVYRYELATGTTTQISPAEIVLDGITQALSFNGGQGFTPDNNVFWDAVYGSSGNRGIFVATKAPQAVAGPDHNIFLGDTIQFDASASTDFDGNPVSSYSWSIVSAPAGSIAAVSNASVANPTFTPDVSGTYVVSLVVSDGVLDSAADTVTINVSNNYLYTHNYSWTKTVGGPGVDMGHSVTTDANGNIYYAGHFQDTVDLDPTTGVDERTAVGNFDMFLTKLNVDGSYAWTRTMGSANYEIAVGVTTDAAGNVFITGQFSDSVDFNPGGVADVHNAVNGYSTFVTRINADGSYGWTRVTSGVMYGFGRTIAVDSHSNVFITGTYSATTDFDPEGAGDIHVPADGNDIFMTRINADGSYGWTITTGTTGYDMGHSVAVDANDTVIFAGHFQGSVDFNPGGAGDVRSSNRYSVDTFVTKYDPAGNYLGTQTFGGELWDGAYEVATDDSGAVYVTGVFAGSSDLDPTAGVDLHTAVGAPNIYVTKLNSDGSFAWARSFEEPSGVTNWGNYFAVEGDGTVYATGCFWGSKDFDFGDGVDLRSAVDQADIFVTRINSDGSYGWTKTMGGTGFDCAISAAVDAGSNLFIAGSFLGTSDFDLDGTGDVRTSAGSNDVFVTRLSANNPPIANAGADQNIYLGQTAQLDGSASSSANGAPLVNYVWTIESAPAGSTAALSVNTVVNPTLTPDVAGDYAISLVVNDGYLNSAASDVVIHVTQNLAPVAVAEADTQAGDAPLSVNFSAAASTDPEGANLSYAWDFADPASIDNNSNLVSPLHTYNAPGTYNAVVTVTDDFGNSDQASVTIQVNAPNMPPTVSPTANPTGGVAPLVVMFAANAGDEDVSSLSYNWDFGDGNTSSLANPQHTYDNAGTYTATVSVSDGEFIVSANIVIAVDSPMHINVTEAKVEYGRLGAAEGRIKLVADYDYSGMPDANDMIVVTFDGITLLDAPFGSFAQGDYGKYVYYANNVRAIIDTYHKRIEVSRRNMVITGVDNSNGIDVVISFGDATGTDHFVMVNTRQDDDDHHDGYNRYSSSDLSYIERDDSYHH